MYQLFEVIQFLKLLNPIVKGSVFIRANPSGDCPRAERYFSAARGAENATPSRRLSAALRNRSSVSNANATAVDGGGVRDGLRSIK